MGETADHHEIVKAKTIHTRCTLFIQCYILSYVICQRVCQIKCKFYTVHVYLYVNAWHVQLIQCIRWTVLSYWLSLVKFTRKPFVINQQLRFTTMWLRNCVVWVYIVFLLQITNNLLPKLWGRGGGIGATIDYCIICII